MAGGVGLTGVMQGRDGRSNRMASNIDHPYFLCLYNLTLSFAEFMNRKGIDGTVDWVFDEGGPIKSEAAVCWYYWIRENAPEPIRQRLGSTPIFRDDTDFLPLKAADLYVWHLRRHLAKEQPKGQQHGGNLEALLSIPGVSNQLRPGDLEALVSDPRLMARSRTLYRWS
jgi:hypothetical protein